MTSKIPLKTTLNKLILLLTLQITLSFSKVIDIQLTEPTQKDQFKDGLPVYTKIYSYTEGKELGKFLVCTSCTYSFVFADPPSGVQTTTTQMQLPENPTQTVTVKFGSVDLGLYTSDAVDAVPDYKFNIQLGFIAPTDAKKFKYESLPMLGLAPTKSTDKNWLERQFLYQFAQKYGVQESFTIMGPAYRFWIGGSQAEFESMAQTQSQQANSKVVNFNQEPISLPDYALNQNGTISQAPPIPFGESDLMLKIQDYVPPVKDELDQQVVVIDTYSQMMKVPTFFYNYFNDTFMIPAYTCDQQFELKSKYPDLKEVYSCYCNNADYHSLPVINVEVKDYNFQFDLQPANYLLLPYINYTRPLSLCVYGVDYFEDTLSTNDQVHLLEFGQRNMAQFPLMLTYQRTSNTAVVQMGGSVKIQDGQNLVVQILISVGVVLLLFAMLVYLIFLRRNRIQAEIWLEENKNILFNSALGLKSQEEILEALVKSQKLQDKMQSPQVQLALLQQQQQMSQTLSPANLTTAPPPPSIGVKKLGNGGGSTVQSSKLSDDENTKGTPLLTGQDSDDSSVSKSKKSGVSQRSARKNSHGNSSMQKTNAQQLSRKSFTNQSDSEE